MRRKKSRISGLIKFVGFVVAVGAASSPFWLFKTTESTPQQVQANTPLSSSTGITGQISLDEIQSNDGSLTSQSASPFFANTSDEKSSSSALTGTIPTPEVPVKVQSSNNATEGEISLEESIDDDAVDQAVAEAQAQNTEVPSTNKDTKAQTEAPHDKDSAAPTKDDNAKEAQASSAPTDANKHATTGSSIVVASADLHIEKQNIASNNSEIPDGLTEEVLPDAENAQKNNLQKELDTILEKQTAQEKAAYEEDLQIRRTINDNAIASITEGSALYLPPVLGERALVVRTFAPKYYKELDGMAHAKALCANKKNCSSTAYISKKLSEISRTKLYTITSTSSFPSSFAEFHKQALHERNEDMHPELIDDVPLDLSLYDTIYFCFPLWWQDMPAACYSFFDKYDLSGKNIIPVSIGSQGEKAPQDLLQRITALEPNALVSPHGLHLENTDITSAQQIQAKLSAWLEALTKEFN